MWLKEVKKQHSFLEKSDFGLQKVIENFMRNNMPKMAFILPLFGQCTTRYGVEENLILIIIENHLVHFPPIVPFLSFTCPTIISVFFEFVLNAYSIVPGALSCTYRLWSNRDKIFVQQHFIA